MLLGFIIDSFSRNAGIVFISALVFIGNLIAIMALKVKALGVSNILWYSTVLRGLAGVGVKC